MNLCFAKCEKFAFFWPFLGQILVDVKNTKRNRYFSTILKAKQWSFCTAIIWAKVGLLSGEWAMLGVYKNGQLGPDSNCANLRAQFFSKQICWNPYFIAFLTNSGKQKTNLAQIITIKKDKLGPNNNSTTYMYMLWSYYLVQVWGLQGLLSGPSRGYYLVQVCFLAYLYSGFKRFFAHSVIILCFFVPNYLATF